MATFKAVVRTSYRRLDGTYRIYIRVTHKRAHKDIPTPFYVTQDQMTRGYKIKDQSLLDKLEDKIREYRESANNLGFIADKLEIKHFIELLDNQSEKIDFLNYFERYIEKLRMQGRETTAELYKASYMSLLRYNNHKPLYFSNITPDYMYKYFKSIEGLRANTQRNYINTIKTVYKKAQSDFNDNTVGIIVVKYGVFDKIDLPQRTSAKDNAFKNVEDFQRIIDEPYRKSWSYEFAKDMFMLAFMCFGTNIRDFLNMEHSQYKDGIIKYRRHKTAKQSGEDADMEVKVPEPGRIIIDKYSGDKKYLINFRGHSRNGRFCRYIHYYFAKAGFEEMPDNLNDIGTKRGQYSFYANRHTMASFARNICKVEYMTVHNMLNHATPSNFKTTDTYLWKDYSDIWEANEKLMALFDWSFYLKQKKGGTGI